MLAENTYYMASRDGESEHHGPLHEEGIAVAIVAGILLATTLLTCNRLQEMHKTADESRPDG